MNEFTDDFNPRPLAGATLLYSHREEGKPYFNPRPLAGATLIKLSENLLFFISIHAPLRGRPKLKTLSPTWRPFQSTPPCGGDCREVFVKFTTPSFQSTPPCGGDKPPLLSTR